MQPGLVVTEIFGPTVQGEGPSVGRRAGFLRLGRCNLACTWCDTPYTWDWSRYDPAEELHRLTVDEVLRQLSSMDVGLVVITGGEPLLQQRRLVPLLEELQRRGIEVEVETAGTIAPFVADGLVTAWNVSPKLANSGNPRNARYRPHVLRAFAGTGRARFKFVVVRPTDLDEIDAIVKECGLDDVWVMPEGVDAATVIEGMRSLVDAVTARGWHLSTRLHILLWGDRRGV